MHKRLTVAVGVVLAVVVMGTAAAVIPPSEQGMPKHWCRNHPRKCKRSLRRAHYAPLVRNGHKVSDAEMGTVQHPEPSDLYTKQMSTAKLERLTGDRSLSASTTTTVPCEKQKMHRRFRGARRRHWWESPIRYTLWNEHLSVNWCWHHHQIVSHWQHSWIDETFWTVNYNPDHDLHRTSEWYPYKGTPIYLHKGRFEGVDGTMNLCVFFFSVSCFITKHPWIHIHEHTGGGFVLNSQYQ